MSHTPLLELRGVSVDYGSGRRTFRAVEELGGMGEFVIFDINHNKFRLICAIKYEWKMVYVRGVLSHPSTTGIVCARLRMRVR